MYKDTPEYKQAMKAKLCGITNNFDRMTVKSHINGTATKNRRNNWESV